ncbi:cilia- and flagella-associated protein 68-like [Tubulanus polymorphus]|uniref:cilia- and flagella-associated protein 68-like n=1 Tax=Tubulanus polymorphus TaxID=672921 RepID=UPI003DA69E8D
MSQFEYEKDPPFREMVRASGQAEVWTHTHDELKFTQFGWRSTTKDTAYGTPTLIGNWNEKRFDIGELKKSKRLPSQYDHYFETTYKNSYNLGPHQVPEELKHLKARHPHAHPAHQPELDSKELKSIYNSFETTQRASYMHPTVRKTPLSK